MMKKREKIKRRVNGKNATFSASNGKRKIKDSSAFRMYQDKVFHKLR